MLNNLFLSLEEGEDYALKEYQKKLKEARRLGKKLMNAIACLHEMYLQDHCLSERILEAILIREPGNDSPDSPPAPFSQNSPYDQSFDTAAFGQLGFTAKYAAYVNQRLIRITLTRELLSWAADAKDRDTFSKTLEQCPCPVTVLRMLPKWVYAGAKPADEEEFMKEWFLAADQETFLPGAYITEKEEYLEQILSHDERIRDQLFMKRVEKPEWQGMIEVENELYNEDALVLIQVDDRRVLVKILSFNPFGNGREMWQPDYAVPALLERNEALAVYFESVKGVICRSALHLMYEAAGRESGASIYSCICESGTDLILETINRIQEIGLETEPYRAFLDRYLTGLTNQGTQIPYDDSLLLKADERCSGILIRHYRRDSMFSKIRSTAILKCRNEWFLKAWIEDGCKKRGTLDGVLVRWERWIKDAGFHQIAGKPAPGIHIITRLQAFYTFLFQSIHSEKARNAARRMLVEDMMHLGPDWIEAEKEEEAKAVKKELLSLYCEVPDYSIYLEKGPQEEECEELDFDGAGITWKFDKVLELFKENQVGQMPYPVDLYTDVLQSELEADTGELCLEEVIKVQREITRIRPIRIEAKQDLINHTILKNGNIKQIKTAIEKGFLTRKNAPAFLNALSLGEIPYEKKVLLMQLCGERQSVFHMLRV